MAGAGYEKRRGETDLQWRSRCARLDAEARDRMQPLVSPETAAHGDYRDADVMHVETQTVAVTKRNRLYGAFDDLFDRGVITKEQRDAVDEIAMVAEDMQRPVSLRCASLEARVDNSSGGRDVLIERLQQVHLEMAYTQWRQNLPTPKQMILQMVLHPGSLAMTARRYRMGWPKARKWLIRALDNWIEMRDRIASQVGQEDIEAAHKRIARVTSR